LNWGLRDYGIEPIIWDGVEGCEHEWGNNNITLKHKSGETNPGKEGWFKDNGASDDKGNSFCLHCSAWRGSLGLEPTFELYIKHLCDIFDEVKRVIRKDGTCWVNLGDSYGSSGGKQVTEEEYAKSIQRAELKNYNVGGWGASKRGQGANNRNFIDTRLMGIPSKSLCLIPQRFAIEMVNRGWILRNTIIWHKPNCMPSSANDRFTVDFEYLFFFVKSSDIQFWTNEKTGNCINKQPLGINGIEGVDWEWRPCPRCQGTGGETKIDKENAEKMGSPRARYHRITEQKVCKRCKGLGKIKVSFWTGHDYWFEQQFEEHKEPWRSTGKIERSLKAQKGIKEGVNMGFGLAEEHPRLYNPQGRNKRSVWTIPTQPFPEAHFATFPEKLIETPIRAGCPEFICKKCGKARVKIFKEATGGTKGHSWHDHSADMKKGNVKKQTGSEYNTYKRGNFIGYTDCGCNAGFEGGIVLDPFSGAGTTAVVAKKQGKKYIGIELKQEYIDMANKRLRKISERLF